MDNHLQITVITTMVKQVPKKYVSLQLSNDWEMEIFNFIKAIIIFHYYLFFEGVGGGTWFVNIVQLYIIDKGFFLISLSTH